MLTSCGDPDWLVPKNAEDQWIRGKPLVGRRVRVNLRAEGEFTEEGSNINVHGGMNGAQLHSQGKMIRMNGYILQIGSTPADDLYQVNYYRKKKLFYKFSLPPGNHFLYFFVLSMKKTLPNINSNRLLYFF